MFKVFDDMRKENVTDAELAEAKTRVAGGMVMAVQTIGQQAGYRSDGILNEYPIDYYDKYPARIGEVKADEVRDVMKKYVLDDAMTIVVVAPAEQVKPQLERLGKVEVVPMPAKRTNAAAATTKPADRELLKKAA
jgi:predicted Zn-dependent peptidase